jgi:hypothetical protein
MANQELLVVVEGKEVKLVSPGSWRFGPVDWSPDPSPVEEERWAFNRDIRARCNANLNLAGLFENVVIAGG